MEPLFSFLLVEGRMHDARMLAVSQLYDDLQNFAFDPVGRAMCPWGSSKPTQGSLAGTFQSWHSNKRYGESMNAVRSSV